MNSDELVFEVLKKWPFGTTLKTSNFVGALYAVGWAENVLYCWLEQGAEKRRVPLADCKKV